MKTFLIANPKGGSGKSTLAANLAGYFASQNRNVMLGDVDRQQSARTWPSMRPAAMPRVRTRGVDHDNIAHAPKVTTHVVLKWSAAPVQFEKKHYEKPYAAGDGTYAFRADAKML